jgi:hypothetical protein
MFDQPRPAVAINLLNVVGKPVLESMKQLEIQRDFTLLKPGKKRFDGLRQLSLFATEVIACVPLQPLHRLKGAGIPVRKVARKC